MDGMYVKSRAPHMHMYELQNVDVILCTRRLFGRIFLSPSVIDINPAAHVRVGTIIRPYL